MFKEEEVRIISSDGVVVSLLSIEISLEIGQPGLRSRAIVPVSISTKITQKSHVRTRKGKHLSAQEIAFEEIKRFAISNPMRIIGLVIIKISTGESFKKIDPVEIFKNFKKNGFINASIDEVKRVMKKIEASELLEELHPGERIGLGRAYHLYKQKNRLPTS